MKIFVPVLVLAAAGAGWAYMTILESEPPVISTREQQVSVGAEYVHEITVSDANRGVQRVRAWIRAGDQDYPIEEQAYEGTLFGGAALQGPRQLELKIAPKALKIADGRASLFIEAVDFSFRGNRSEVEVPILIDTRPPLLSLRTGLTYVRRGGSELAVYSVNEEVERHGIQVGDLFYPGFPHPTEKGAFAAFYGIPWSKEQPAAARVIARDKAGNETAVELSISLLERQVRSDRLVLTEDFMRKKVAELGGDPDDVVASFVKINSVMREENARTLRELCQTSSSERLWSEPFIQMKGSEVGAGFAEQRTYVYDEREIDKQVHLGFDLASNSREPIPAANDGAIVFAGPLGIYGNTVVIDHGMGLFSLYGHLSEIGVERGKPVSRGDVIGRTGTSGLAGGDHLHYGILLSGEFVDPIEWFDKKWIDEHLEVKLRVREQPPADGSAAVPAAHDGGR